MDDLYMEIKSLANLIIQQNEAINILNDKNEVLTEMVKTQTIAINNLIMAYNGNAINTNETLSKLNIITNKISDMEIKSTYTDDEVRTNSERLVEVNSMISETKTLLETVASQMPYRWGNEY